MRTGSYGLLHRVLAPFGWNDLLICALLASASLTRSLQAYCDRLLQLTRVRTSCTHSRTSSYRPADRLNASNAVSKRGTGEADIPCRVRICLRVMSQEYADAGRAILRLYQFTCSHEEV